MRSYWPFLLLLVSCCHAQSKDVIFYASFDRGGTVRAGEGWASDLPTRPDSFVPGRFGQAYRMERPRTNLLSPNQASIETDTAGFTGDRLDSFATSTPYGKRVLRAQVAGPGAAFALEPLRLKVPSRIKPAKTFVLSAYLRSDQPAKVRLSLQETGTDAAWQKKIEADNKAALEKDPQAKLKSLLQPAMKPGEITLSPQWQRVAAVLEVDARQPEQLLVGRLEVLEGAPATILADGLQLEQAAVYPLSNTDPTTWLAGGETRGPSWLDISAADLRFEGKTGTFGCWVRPLPNQSGGTRDVRAIVTLGTGWFTPVWQIGGTPWYAGDCNGASYKLGAFYGGNAEKALFEPGLNDGWHQLVMAWDEQEVSGYLDGKRFSKVPLKTGVPAPGALLRLGGSFLEQTPMTGDLDEVFLLRNRLTDEEVAAMAQTTQPLSAELPQVSLKHPLRLTFLRSEADATISLEPTAAATVTAEIPALRAKITGKAAPGKPLVLALKPWLAEPGKYPLRVTVKTTGQSGASAATVADYVEIFEEPQGREFIIYAWSMDPDLKERGFNSAVAAGRGAHRDLLERGMWANARIDVRDGIPHPWSAQTREKAKTHSVAVAREAMANPNIVSCLVNSEVGNPPFPVDAGGEQLQPWFAQWMQRENGLSAIPPEVTRNPMHVLPNADRIPPAVVPMDYPPLKFLQWWQERGQGYWLLGSEIAKTMRATGLTGINYYSDQPEALAQFAEMDMIDYWGYPRCPEGLVARFNHTNNYARLLGKRFQAMPGTVYWDDGNGLWVQDEGKRKVLGLSPDCFRENLWMSVACPSYSIGLYGLGERKTEVYDKTCDQVMTDTYALMQPIGTLVGGLPQEAAPVAMLETDGLNFIQPGITDDWVRHWITRNVSRTLARSRVPFDWIGDEHVKAGWLKQYKAIALPGAWVLPEETHKALVSYAKSGGKILADKSLRADIPGVQKLDIENQAGPQEAIVKEWGSWGQQMREAYPGFAQVSSPDKVFMYTREATAGKQPVPAARYIFLINDNREPGPQYDRFKVNLIPADGGGPLRDKGLPTDVTLTVPKGFALYDVLAHKQLKPVAQGVKQTVQVHLEPGAAAVIAALPQPIAKLQATLPATMKPGTQALLSLQVLDSSGKPVRGRQLAELKVTTPEGEWPGVQRYLRIVDGKLTVPLRLPLSAKRGQWRVEVTEWVSGLTAAREVAVR
ncbi:MAG: LamG-like jellyroll fold domain-containing protein [Armatimonadota bacterium]